MATTKIDTTDNSRDSKNRAIPIILSPDRDKMLIGRAPNKSKDKLHMFDIVGKGHIEYGDDPKDTIVREAYEEGNLDLEGVPIQELGEVRYGEGTGFVYVLVLPEDPTNLECHAVFDWYGKQLPEFVEYKWVRLDEAEEYLYKKLGEALFQKNISSLKNTFMGKIKEMIKMGIL